MIDFEWALEKDVSKQFVYSDVHLESTEFFVQRQKFLVSRCGVICMPAEIVGPAVEAIGEFMDAEENKWWIRPLKVLLYIGVFSFLPIYFYFL